MTLTSFNLNYPLKVLLSKTISQGVRDSAHEGEGIGNSVHSKHYNLQKTESTHTKTIVNAQ
jgi:hypothetical protein